MTIEELLAEHRPAVAELAGRIVDRLRSSTDWSEMRVYPGWHGIGFHHSELGYVVGVFPRVDSVRVLFEQGHLLGEAQFLEGDGQTRYVELTKWDESRVGVIDDLLDRALAR